MIKHAHGTHVLVTGGAGFIGSHLTDRLLADGYTVRILDNLTPQVHGERQHRPDYLAGEAELMIGDVRDRDAVRAALDGVDAVVHLAAAVGVGQSMYEVADYTSTNSLGTAVLMEALIERPVTRLVVASSMSIYGEGRYRTREGRVHDGVERTAEQLRHGAWEPVDDRGTPLQPVPTPEIKGPSLASNYALTKYDQERMCLITGRAYGISTLALRLFNVYGPRQALSNPYTGVLAIFLSRLKNGKPPLIYEDGRQQRDFVSVHDVARAFHLAVAQPDVADAALNIGSGHRYRILDIAAAVAAAVGCEGLSPEITGQYRAGDIRHCFADTSAARERLGFQAEVSLRDGLEELAMWLDTQDARDQVDFARRELETRGLTA